mmetsp:Transcript_22425/g.60650  ORF Transcript_22425/g.60650 Transcript_22425/m.60650 type:complete len:222 (-) Transcript_22425:2115-2780(-)
MSRARTPAWPGATRPGRPAAWRSCLPLLAQRRRHLCQLWHRPVAGQARARRQRRPTGAAWTSRRRRRRSPVRPPCAEWEAGRTRGEETQETAVAESAIRPGQRLGLWAEEGRARRAMPPRCLARSAPQARAAAGPDRALQANAPARSCQMVQMVQMVVQVRRAPPSSQPNAQGHRTPLGRAPVGRGQSEPSGCRCACTPSAPRARTPRSGAWPLSAPVPPP